MDFFLFLLVNATLFIRPSEIVPALGQVPIYLVLIMSCLFCTLPAVIGQLSSLEKRPITLGLLGMLLAVPMSDISNGNFEEVGPKFFEFFKVVIYYLLFLSIVNSRERLRVFLIWLGIFCAVLASLTLLRYHKVIDIAVPAEVLEKKIDKTTGAPRKGSESSLNAAVQEKDTDENTGMEIVVDRLQGTGTFNDPNDLCLALVTGILLCVYWLTDSKGSSGKILWFGAMLLFGYALALTHSRGGFLGLMTGLAILFNARYGWRRTLALGMLGLPFLFILFAGRMTSLSATEGTSQQRIQIWSDGLLEFQASPLFGIGMDKYAASVSFVAHNSFLHCFVELGLVGGTLFLGLFYVAFSSLRSMGGEGKLILDPEMRRLYPTLLAVVGAYIVGMMSLSRSYDVPTYTILGLATVFLRLATVYPPVPVQRIDASLIKRVIAASIGFMAMMYVFVRLTARW